MHKISRYCLIGSMMLPASPVPGQQPARAAPSQTGAATTLPYESAFSGYRAYRDESIADWRAINDEVGRIGGHIGIVGGAGHSGHGPAKASAAPEEQGQPPQRGAPQSPAGDHAQHH
ncbi:MAG: hypothetical protein ACXWUH_04380 [Burkholderiales bacterium]